MTEGEFHEIFNADMLFIVASQEPALWLSLIQTCRWAYLVLQPRQAEAIERWIEVRRDPQRIGLYLQLGPFVPELKVELTERLLCGRLHSNDDQPSLRIRLENGPGTVLHHIEWHQHGQKHRASGPAVYSYFVGHESQQLNARLAEYGRIKIYYTYGEQINYTDEQEKLSLSAID
jgi:hypothetical protein